MTRVCLIGTPDCNLQYELLSRETSREALSTYDLERPFENSIALRTVSVGAAVSLLNDLNWYLTRFVDEALVQEPSVSDDEWLSRPLATELRNGAVESAETAEFCKIYGLERVGPEPDGTEQSSAASDGGTPAGAATASAEPSDPDGTSDSSTDDSDASANGEPDSSDTAGFVGSQWRLVEPLYVRRTDGDLPEYDLRDVEETLVVRLTEAEHAP
ncbi:DUF5804 family protein [Natronorubrum texcoconense]|uniref:Uncharacterized protein n=1 Tax=Natronorubrum texcoconense TaxID=1095776 RepID=A0A1G9A1Q2_9EURY|nr:DUF5804 family protein [Natronorubrum texcoconense]SDK21191.1 hypothetical protein SAMN04515672_2542 [Natronorubrum texcoconense]